MLGGPECVVIANGKSQHDRAGAQHFLSVSRAGVNNAEVGRGCVFRVSGEADFVNGTAIEHDGGMLPGGLYDAGLKTIADLL